MMNFRQRMGWIGVGLYLLASVAAVYYVFEINQTYNRFTLAMVEKAAASVAHHHTTQPLAPPDMPLQGSSSSSSSSVVSVPVPWLQSLKTRLLLLPFWVWAVLFLLPYLQVFLFLYSCTRADPKTIGYCILPICIAVLCNRHQTFTKASNQISRLQLIDT
ncbi:lysosomal enzyme trafficking factor [Engraulis encrasicolus]|uniref:lysosomal enzyme trafficking factor n=1 Tax=Engraulis encrasicolus TaxID=184585 RepID=UPI002FCEB781